MSHKLARVISDWSPAAPLLILSLLLLVLPTVTIVLMSFRQESGWGIGVWAETLSRKADRRAITTSLSLAFACATCAMVIGTPLAWAVSQAKSGSRSAWLSLLNVAANFGGIGLAFAYMALLGVNGMITIMLRESGLPFAPPAVASFTGLLIAYLYTNIPLFVLLTLPAMGALQREWFEAAATIGASRPQIWRYIGLPVLAPFLFAGWLLIFTWTIGIYGLCYALAGTSPTSPVRLMTLQIGLALNQTSSGQPRAAVMAALLLIIASAALLIYRHVTRKAARWL